MRRTHVVIVVVAALVGVFGVFTPVQAGTGSAASCSDGNSSGNSYGIQEVRILENPITLALQGNGLAGNGYDPNEPLFRLCYSTSPVGYSGLDTTGGSISIGKDWYWAQRDATLLDVECTPQSNQSAVTTSCFLGAHLHSYYPRPDATVCVNSCTRVTWPFGETTVFGPDEFELRDDLLNPSRSRPAGTQGGAGITIPNLGYCVDGACSMVTENEGDAGVGYNQPFGTTLFYYSSPVCASTIGGCLGLPAATVTNNGAPVAIAQVGSTMVPVAAPVGNCVVTTAVLSTCPLP